MIMKEKKRYIVPCVQTFEVSLSEIICESDRVNIGVGGPPNDELDAARRRHSDWDEYMKM